MRDKTGMPDPAPDEECLTPPRAAPADPAAPPAPGQTPPAPPLKPAAQSAVGGATAPTDAIDTGISDILAGDGWVKMVEPMIAGLSDKLAGAGSLDEVRAVLAAHLATMDTGALAETLAKAAFSARLAGRVGDDLGPTK
jgi:phage gp29-like protein